MKEVKLRHIKYEVDSRKADDGWQVVFQVKELDKRFWLRNASRGYQFFEASNGMDVIAGSSTRLGNKEIALRGRPTEAEPAVFRFITRILCIECRDKLSDALKEWDESWDGWHCPASHRWSVRTVQDGYGGGVKFGEVRFCLICKKLQVKFPGKRWVAVKED